jgi:hypothetical protein
MKRILAPILLLTLLFPSLAYGVTMDDLVVRDGIHYKKFTEVPFTGKVTGKTQGSFRNGKEHGPWVSIFADGTVWEKFTGTFLNGKKVKPSQYIVSEIRHQISQCWNIPLTIPKTEYLRIKVKIELKMNGGLKIEPIIIDKLQYKNSEYYRLQEKSVMMSLRNPKCVPLKLPVSLYNIWKKTVFTFDFRSFFD